MIFSSLFRTKEQKESISKIERLCIDNYKKNEKIDLKKIQKQLDNLDFRVSHRDKVNIFINFIQEFDGKKLPVECVDHFNGFANMLSVRDDGKISNFLDNLENKIDKVKRMDEIMRMKKLPVINVDIILKKQEEAYFDTQVTFYEERTKRVYQGGSVGTSIRVAKGVSFRVGSNKGNAVSEDYMKEIDTGEFIITNKRIVFVGENKSWNIPLAKLMRIQEMTIDDYPTLSFSSETTSKKKFVAFSDENDSFEARAILNRVTKGDECVEETVAESTSNEDILVLGDGDMEDEVLD